MKTDPRSRRAVAAGRARQKQPILERSIGFLSEKIDPEIVGLQTAAEMIGQGAQE